MDDLDGMRQPRVLVVTDSDSYVKWGASLSAQLPKDWDVRLVVARGNVAPSDRQLAEALEGTRFDGTADIPGLVDRVGLAELRAIVEGWRPDVLLATARGWTVQSMMSVVPNVPDRPVIVSGMAGIAVPVLPFGLGFRRAVDIFVVHSRRELREFAIASRRLSVPLCFELATMPFLATAPRTAVPASMHASPEPSGTSGPRDEIVFAAQALVPSSRRDRAWLLGRLADTARAHPHLRVVVKVRAQHGEGQTHTEQVSYQELFAELASAGQAPANLVIEGGSMAGHLRRAVGLVTVSSTALLEAIADDVPCLAITDFGVGDQQINVVLEDSGILGTTDDLVAGEFKRPYAAWMRDNYFHEASHDTWTDRVEELLRVREQIGLPPYAELPRTWANIAKPVFYRHLAFAPEKGSRRDLVERAFLSVALRLNRVRWALLRLARPTSR